MFVKIVFGVVLALLVFVVLFFLLWRNSARCVKNQRATIEKLRSQWQDLALENRKLKASIIAFNENRRDADEKIELLHSGDAVDNAVSLLQKR